MNSKNISVLWVAPYPYEVAIGSNVRPGHYAPWITALAEKIRNNVNLTVVCFSSKVANDMEFENQGIKFHVLKIPGALLDAFFLFSGTLLKLKRFIRKLDFDQYNIIHLHGTEHQYGSAFRNIDKPKVISVQGLLHKTVRFTKGFNYNFIRWSVIKYFEFKEIRTTMNFICRTHWDSRTVKDLNPRSEIFYNWEILRPAFFADAFDQDSYNLVFMGGVVPMKGIRETLRAFSVLCEADSRYSLTVCGSGSEGKLYDLISSMGLAEICSRVRFYGKVSAAEILELYKVSYCLIHPSYIDNSPNSVCEAQVCGLPVIASNVGGVSSLIRNNETGLLVERYQTAELARMVTLLKEEPELYRRISAQSRAEARVRHDPEDIAQKTLNIYTQVIGDASIRS